MGSYTDRPGYREVTLPIMPWNANKYSLFPLLSQSYLFTFLNPSPANTSTLLLPLLPLASHTASLPLLLTPILSHSPHPPATSPSLLPPLFLLSLPPFRYACIFSPSFLYKLFPPHPTFPLRPLTPSSLSSPSPLRPKAYVEKTLDPAQGAAWPGPDTTK